MKSFIKKNIKFIIVVVICITCSVLTTFATDYLFNSSEVYYNNTTSGIQADKVQGAIDELYACASNYAAYNQRLTNAENTIGSGSLTTTSQNLIGAVNEINSKKLKIDFLGSKASNGTYSHTSIEGYDIIVVALVDQGNAAIHGTTMFSRDTYKTTNIASAVGVTAYNNGRIYAYSNYLSSTTSNAQVSAAYALYLYGIKWT